VSGCGIIAILCSSGWAFISGDDVVAVEQPTAVTTIELTTINLVNALIFIIRNLLVKKILSAQLDYCTEKGTGFLKRSLMA
jgi:hypothetical protein